MAVGLSVVAFTLVVGIRIGSEAWLKGAKVGSDHMILEAKKTNVVSTLNLMY